MPMHHCLGFWRHFLHERVMRMICMTEEHIQVYKAVRVLYIVEIGGLLPVLQVGQERYKVILLQVSLLR
jgi:hypothetical protein